jgi:hypothetical protein
MHIAIILPVISQGCETWSFTLREGHKLQVFVKTKGSEKYSVLRKQQRHFRYHHMYL